MALNYSLSIASSMSTALQLGDDGVVSKLECLSIVLGDLQHQGIQQLSKHLTLLQQKLHVITMRTAMMKVGIPKIRLELCCHHAGFVVASTESNFAMAGP